MQNRIAEIGNGIWNFRHDSPRFLAAEAGTDSVTRSWLGTNGRSGGVMGTVSVWPDESVTIQQGLSLCLTFPHDFPLNLRIDSVYLSPGSMDSGNTTEQGFLILVH